jgi:hypothetical protein
VVPEWVGRAKLFLERLAKVAPREAAALIEELGERPTRIEVEQFVALPAAWFVDSSWRAWETVGQLADEVGGWTAAQTAFESAAERAPEDHARAGLLARASAAAGLLGNETRAEQLLASAEALESTHPSVRLVTARREGNARQRLRLLQAVTPEDADQTAWLYSLEALAYLETDDFGAAREAAAKAESAGSSIPVVIEARALVSMLASGRDRASGRSPDYAAVEQAAEDFAALRQRLADVERWDEAAGLLAYAVQSLVIAGREDDARRLLDTASAEERSGAAATRLGLAALETGDFVQAADLLGSRLSELDDEGRVAYAAALLRSDPERFKTQGLGLLEEVFQDDSSSFRSEAAWFLAGAMGVVGEYKAGHSALAFLREEDPPRAAIVQAHLLEEDDPAAADALLLRHQDDHRVLRTRLQLAVARDDRETALALFNRILERDRDPEIALWRANFLYDTATPAEALDAALPIARDLTVPRPFGSLHSRVSRIGRSMLETWNATSMCYGSGTKWIVTTESCSFNCFAYSLRSAGHPRPKRSPMRPRSSRPRQTRRP